MKILLVSPSSKEDLLSSSLKEVAYLQAEAFFAPHALATVAALTPPEHRVRIHDEQLHGSVVPLLTRESFDVVGITLKATQLARIVYIAQTFRQMKASGQLVVGGIGTTYMLDQLKELVDTAFYGEVEETWPEYLQDLKCGKQKPLYQRASKPDLTKSPPPRWDLIEDDIPRYSTASVQTTRGCHFDCSFCDVIYTFGRTPRFKNNDQILYEIQALKRMGARMVYFADDNFCSNRKKTKELLRRLVRINNAYDEPIGFLTQVDITIAKDRELLELLADCNFNQLQIGIESSNPNSLNDLNKQANSTVDLVDAVRRIQSFGLLVMAHMIIGTDSDDQSAFQRTLDFIDKANIVNHLCHPLAAPPGTKLWYKLKRQGRILAPAKTLTDRNEIGVNLDSATNIIPQKMTRIELLEGLADLWEQAFDLNKHHRRLLKFFDGISRVPQVRPAPAKVYWKYRKMMFEMMLHHAFRVSSQHRKVFFHTLARVGRTSPDLIPRAIFAHTGFVMERSRALRSAQQARAQAAWETKHPESVHRLPKSTPLPAPVRNNARKIFEPAYHRVRAQVGDKETLYQTVIAAMLDYTDRFGESLEEVNETQIVFINESCDRILTQLNNAQVRKTDILPSDRPPRGFVRDILDGLDRSIRLKEL